MWKEIQNNKDLELYFQDFIHSSTEFVLKCQNKVISTKIYNHNLNNNELALRPIKYGEIFDIEEGQRCELVNLRENISFFSIPRKIKKSLIFMPLPSVLSLKEERKYPRYKVGELNYKVELVNKSVISYKSGHNEKFKARLITISEKGVGIEIYFSSDSDEIELMFREGNTLEIHSLNNTSMEKLIKTQIAYVKRVNYFKNKNLTKLEIGMRSVHNANVMDLLLNSTTGM